MATKAHATRRPLAAPAATPPLRRSIDLDVAGEDLMLKGRFSDWESGLALGPDLDQAGVRLAIDATSAASDPAEAPPLLAFSSRDVQPAGTGTYRAVGTLTGARGERPLEVMIETPIGHTPLFVLSFVAEKQDLGDGWHDLMQNVIPFPTGGEGDAQRAARAWLVPPVLAAA
jgi:hypothetical protein